MEMSVRVRLRVPFHGDVEQRLLLLSYKEASLGSSPSVPTNIVAMLITTAKLTRSSSGGSSNRSITDRSGLRLPPPGPS